MSELSQALKRILLPVALATAFGGIAPAYANTVRIVGPENEDPNAWVQHSEQMRSSSFDYVKTPNKPYTNVRRYGPTSAKETLWSIASRHRPNNSVSVYQVIGAIKHINPQAFENNSRRENFITENVININKTYGKHSFDALFVFSYQQESFFNTRLESNNFADDNF